MFYLSIYLFVYLYIYIFLVFLVGLLFFSLIFIFFRLGWDFLGCLGCVQVFVGSFSDSVWFLEGIFVTVFW